MIELTITYQAARMAVDTLARQEVHENIFTPGNACQCDDCGAYRTSLAALLIITDKLPLGQTLVVTAKPPETMRIKGKTLVQPIQH